MNDPRYPPHDMNTASPYPAGSPAQFHKLNNYSTGDVSVNMRQISRTPSPTPSEVASLKSKHLLDFQAMKNWRFWIRREWICTSHDDRPVVPLCLLLHTFRVLRHWHHSWDHQYPVHCLSQADRQCSTACGQLDAQVSPIFHRATEGEVLFLWRS